MIVCIGYLTIDPSKRDEALTAIDTCVSATRAKEGNLDYRYSTDLGDPNRVNITEQWEDEAAITAHMGSAHLATFLEAIGGCLGGPAEVFRHDVSSSAKLV